MNAKALEDIIEGYVTKQISFPICDAEDILKLTKVVVNWILEYNYQSDIKDISVDSQLAFIDNILYRLNNCVGAPLIPWEQVKKDINRCRKDGYDYKLVEMSKGVED